MAAKKKKRRRSKKVQPTPKKKPNVKKKPKPPPRPRKPRKPSKKELRQRALKGWKTRRKNLKQKKRSLEDRANEILKKQADAKRALEEAKQLLADINEERDAIQEEARIAGVTFDPFNEFKRRDGSQALFPSGLRHEIGADEYADRLHQASGGRTPEEFAELLKQANEGDSNAKNEVRQMSYEATIIAGETGYTVREVYTLFWSP